jgi:hypothetical protein
MHLNLPKAAELRPNASLGFGIQGAAALLLFTLIVGIRCSGSITGERERQTWEAVLLTPLSAKQIVRDKLWGVLGACNWYLLAYAAPAVVLSALGGLGALFLTLLALAVTLLAMYFIGAVAISSSVRSRTSWGALLVTLLAGGAVSVATVPAIFVAYGIILLVLLIIGTILNVPLAGPFWGAFSTFFVASCIGLALAYWLTARWFLNRSVRHIADRERTRHWYDEPVYRRARRPELDFRLPSRA